MKQLAQYQDGRIRLEEVPEPALPPGGILVRTTASVISPGTERMKVEQARMSLLAKARARPDQVRKVLQTARTLGWRAALEKVKNRLESPAPLGYSAAGVVVAVDEACARFKVGDRVAVGGAECAHHAEVLGIPELLAAAVPEGVEDWQAAYTTLASISMQGVRMAGVSLGERVLVVGQGLVGLLATGILRAAGVRVAAMDLDARRLKVAQVMGAERVLTADQRQPVEDLREWSEGYGVDAVLYCAGAAPTKTMRVVVESLRQRGVLVVVGMADVKLEWKQAYMKEVELRYARSYGPGRYDESYEWQGLDYPIQHARWTENRNFESCLHLMKTGALNLEPLTTRRVAFSRVVKVYERMLEAESRRDIGVVIEYGPAPEVEEPEGVEREPLEVKAVPQLLPMAQRPKGLNVVGAGNFVRTMLLPHLKGRIPFSSVINSTGLSAAFVKDKFGFDRATTGPENAFRSPDLAVLVGTRNHLHAKHVLAALAAEQQCFVEKPLCLTRGELRQIREAAAGSAGSVMVGFNRRFAPATKDLKEVMRGSAGPFQIACQINAGQLDPTHWYANPDQSGGRIVSEVCHFMDWLRCVLEAELESVMPDTVAPVRGDRRALDSVTAQLRFTDGSLAQLMYSAAGDSGFPKESFRVFGQGMVAELTDFRRLTVHAGGRSRTTTYRSKGHAEEMEAWLAFLRGDAPHPLPLQEAMATTAATFDLADALQGKVWHRGGADLKREEGA
ncbi:MAG: bi-domain-containing oxidoreductase [Verrucomicrobiales bacterium]|nr:bi-domain-containing oxidoreductase [Verrucomicrobiales bacterium]